MHTGCWHAHRLLACTQAAGMHIDCWHAHRLLAYRLLTCTSTVSAHTNCARVCRIFAPGRHYSVPAAHPRPQIQLWERTLPGFLCPTNPPCSPAPGPTALWSSRGWGWGLQSPEVAKSPGERPPPPKALCSCGDTSLSPVVVGTLSARAFPGNVN